MKSGPNTVSHLLINSQKGVDTWIANPAFSMGNLTLKQLQDARDTAASLCDLVETKRLELVALANQRDEASEILRDMTSRARSGFRAFYGPDSTQYEQAGGVRSSERKTRSAAKKAPSKAAS